MVGEDTMVKCDKFLTNFPKIKKEKWFYQNSTV